MQAPLAEYENAHKHIIAALQTCDTNRIPVLIVVMSQIMAELACQMSMSKETLLAGVSSSYDLSLEEEKADAGEPH
jgi:hypothetical protein